MRCFLDIDGVQRSQVGLTSGCRCEFVQNWFNVADGCGDLPGFPPVSIYCAASPSNVTTPLPCVGDFNGDSQTNLNDMELALSAWGAPYTLSDVVTVVDDWQCQVLPVVSCFAPTVAPAEYWTFNVDGSNQVRGRPSLTLSGNATIVQTPAFFGAGSLLGVEALTSIVGVGTGDFSVELWISPVVPLSIQSKVKVFQWIDFSISIGGDLVFYDFGSTTISSLGGPPTVFRPNQWYSIAVTRQGTMVRIYYNGYQVASGQVTPAASLPGFVRMGAATVAVDDVSLYRLARSQHEIFTSHTERRFSRAEYCTSS